MTVSRRALLTGAAGLAVGAGAGVAGTAAADSPTPPDPSRLPSANEELMTEHGVLKRVLLGYRAIVERIDAGRTVPTGVVADSAQIILDYVENFHEGLEEAYVFPRVRAAEPTLIRTLLDQHDRGRVITARLLTVPAALPRAARTAVRSDLAAFVRMYEPHEAFEDTVVYPALRTALTPAQLTELAERFHDLSDKEFGDDALQRALQRVRGVEQQLGIGDLASFTP